MTISYHQGIDNCSAGQLVPSICSGYACARTARRVSDSCAAFFADDTFSAGSRRLLDTLADACAPVNAPSKVVGLHELAGGTIKDPCAATLTDGLDALSTPRSLFLHEKMGWVVEAPRGRVLQLDVDQIWLPDGMQLSIYDGFDSLSPLLGSFTEKPRDSLLGLSLIHI